MKIRDSPKIGIKFTENNTSRFIEVTNKTKGIFIEFDYIIRSTNISKKQLNLYLWRHKDKIETHKELGVKFVSLNVLEYLFKSIKRKRPFKS